MEVDENGRLKMDSSHFYNGNWAYHSHRIDVKICNALERINDRNE